MKYANGRAEAILIKSVQITSGSVVFPNLPGWYYGVHETVIPAEVAGLFTKINNVAGNLTNGAANANFLITANTYDGTNKKHAFRVAIQTANDYWTYIKKIAITGKWK